MLHSFIPIQSMNMKKRNNQDPVRVEIIHGHEIGFYLERYGNELLEVPSHIRRLDNPEGGLHGWQFSMVRKGVYSPSFFVPDGERGMAHALDIATLKLRVHLRGIDPRRNIPYKLKDIKTGINRTGVAGVRMVWRFNRKRSLYELNLEARAGKYANSRMLRVYVGTEFTVTDQRIKEAFRKTRDFRQFQIERLLIGNTYKLPIKRPGRRKMGVTIEQAQKLLETMKLKHDDYHWDFVVEQWPSLEVMSYMTQWRRSRFTWRTENVYGYDLPVPDFVERVGDKWEISLLLPSGAIFGDSQNIGYDPEASLYELVVDGLVQHLGSAANLIPDDSVHGPRVRHTISPQMSENRA